MSRSMCRTALAVLATGVLGAAALPAQAQGYPAPAPYQRNFYLGLFGGLSGGGDRLAEVNFTNGERESIRAGGLYHLGIGAVWQPPLAPVSVQATIGWHADSIDADNGDIRFSRVPVEVIGYLHPAPQWRFGGGLRWVSGAELKTDVGGFSENVRFKDSTGVVVEGGYRLGPNAWLNLRYTVEDYEVESVNGFNVIPTGKTSGNAVGMNIMFIF